MFIFFLFAGDSIGPGLQITGNTFMGGSIYHEQPSHQILLPQAALARTMSKAPRPFTPLGVEDVLVNNNYFDSHPVTTRASLTISQKDSSRWVFDFTGILLFPTLIAEVRYSAQVEEGFPRILARPAVGGVVVIESDVPFSGTVTVDVDSSTYKNKLM